jgi:hypothetical protein
VDLRSAIDHCHDTKAVRGILCDLCNLGIGNFHDAPERLRRAADYLDLAQARQSTPR